MAYVLGVDTWHGNPVIDEALLIENGVNFIIVRLNNMNGGHHLDSAFKTQWAQSGVFVAAFIYFVYNPWVTGPENFAWLKRNMPSDCKTVSIDIEVRYPGYSPVEYAYQVGAFLELAKQHWNIVIYSGGGFTELLSHWPTGYPYWWARYDPRVKPTKDEPMTWARLKAKLDALPWNPGIKNQTCNMWQVSGDQWKLPGCPTGALDINIWNKSLDDLVAWVNSPASPPQDWRQSITAWARDNGYVGPDPD